jgi:hypothetical protein
VPENPKKYLMRWNPSVSSFTEQDFKECLSKMVHGMFRMNWSIYEWEEAHENDRFYMLRTGDDKPGIVFRGIFTSEPYEDEDWNMTDKLRHYVDMDCYDCISADEQSPITVKMLEESIPNINWRAGHSGELLSDEDAEKLDDMWEEIV